MILLKKYLFILLLFCLFLTFIYFLFLRKDIYTFHSVSLIASNQLDTEKKIEEIAPDYTYKVNIHYPYTGYSILNQEIESLIKKYLDDKEEKYDNNVSKTTLKLSNAIGECVAKALDFMFGKLDKVMNG